MLVAFGFGYRLYYLVFICSAIVIVFIKAALLMVLFRDVGEVVCRFVKHVDLFNLKSIE